VNELRTTQPHAVSVFTPDQVSLLKSQICRGASDDELKLFMQVCNRTGLDPFARQIYAVFRKDNKNDCMKMTIQTSIDGFRLIAQRSKEYAGQAGPEWCGQDGVWRDVWLSKDAPAAARVGVLRAGFREPVWAVALWSEFCQMAYGKVTQMWQSLPTVMLAKCAESQALRRVFPQELSGIYSEEEMAQADNPKEDEYEWTDEDRANVKLLTQDLGQIFMDAGLTEEVIAVILDPTKSKQMNSIGDPSVTYTQWTNRWVKWSSDQIKKHCPVIESKPTQTEEK